MNLPTIAMLLCVSATYLACCARVVQVLARTGKHVRPPQVAGLWTGCFALSVIGCLLLDDVAGRLASAVFAATVLASGCALGTALRRRLLRTEHMGATAFREARSSVARARAETLTPLSPEMLCAHLARAYDLTRREEEVLALLLEGRTQAELPDVLTVSENTVKTHVRHIYRKLGVRSKGGLLEKVAAVQDADGLSSRTGLGASTARPA